MAEKNKLKRDIENLDTEIDKLNEALQEKDEKIDDLMH